MGKQALDWTQHPFEAPLEAIHDAFVIALTPADLLLSPWRGWGGGKGQGGLAFELWSEKNIIGRTSDTLARFSWGNVGRGISGIGRGRAGLPNAVGRIFGLAGQSAQGAISGLAKAPSFLAYKAVQAFQYANLRNLAQSIVPKLASSAISIGANIAGDLTADAFGRILPRNTPPVLRESAKIAVGTAVAFAVSGGNPVVAGTYAVVSVVRAIFAIPKHLGFVLAFISAAAAFQYYRQRRWLRLQRLRPVRGAISMRL